MTEVCVVFIGEGLAEMTRKSFVSEGKGNVRRPREFSGGDGKWHGEISYGSHRQHWNSVVVESVSSAKEAPKADWYVVSCDGLNRHFTSSLKRLSRLGHRFGLPDGNILLLSGEKSLSEKYWPRVATNAANHLAAEITGAGVYQPVFLSFPQGRNSRHFESLADWIKDNRDIKLVSGCCLNADESRRGIVDYLEPTIVDLLSRTAQAAFDRLPVSDWYIYTFGPKDYEFLGDMGIRKVLLPYMWDAPPCKVIADMAKNYELIVGLGEAIQRRVNFPVHVGQLSDYTQEVDIAWLVEASRERARKMLPGLLAHPPAIFAQLQSPDDVFDRVQQEAFLYLLDTIRWGQTDEADRPTVLYAGLEVHGGYWVQGNLFEGPKGEFLPLAWLPQCVRQHWGPWVMKNQTLSRERQHLEIQLKYFGY